MFCVSESTTQCQRQFRAIGQMKISVSRSSILQAIVVAILLVFVPGEIRRIIETGNFYLFTEEFFRDMLQRLSGPGRFRFILQPTVAIVLGARDGVKDARAGGPPFLWALLFRQHQRWGSIKVAFQSTRELVSVAILLDIISQFLIFHTVHPGAALLLGPVLIGTPYAASRGLANRIWWKRVQRVEPLVKPELPPSQREQPR